MLAADARAGALAWRAFCAVPPVRHSSEPDEPQYLHDLRADVHQGDEGPEDHHRRDHPVRGPPRLHQPVAVPVVGNRLGTAGCLLRRLRATPSGNATGCSTRRSGMPSWPIFNFPINQGDHPRQAVLAAQDIQRRWNARRQTLGEELGLARAELGVGIGIHCGELSFGEFGRSHRDLTAIGTVVNLASRAQSAAAAGEILVTQAVYERAPVRIGGQPAAAARAQGLRGAHDAVRGLTEAEGAKKLPGPKTRQVKQGGFTSGRRRIRRPSYLSVAPRYSDWSNQGSETFRVGNRCKPATVLLTNTVAQ